MKLLKKVRKAVGCVVPSREEWSRCWTAFALAVASALLLRLAYQPFHQSWIAFVALVPLFWGLRRCKPVMAFYVGTLFGAMLGYFGTGWLTIVSRFNPVIYVGIVPLAVWIGVHYGVALSLLVWFARRLAPWPAIALGMSCLAGVEYFRMIGALGLPYGLLAQSQGGWLAMAQTASLGGMPLLTALIIGVNLALMETIAAFHARYGHAGALTRLGTMVAAVVLLAAWGWRVIEATRALDASPESRPFRVALLQSNIEQEMKYASYAAEEREERQRLQDEIALALLRQIEELKPAEVDLIVTPESSLTSEFFDSEESFQREYYGGVLQYEVIRRAQDLATPIVVGANENTFRTKDGKPTESILQGLDPEWKFHPGNEFYGGLWVFRPEHPLEVRTTSDYRKVHLMPFGEHVPYLGLIPGFTTTIVGIGEFTAGKLGPPIGVTLPPREHGEAPGLARLGFSICFEDLFPYLHNHFAREGTDVFVNTTNDSWFDGSPGPRWHLDMARWRSIETRIPMVRCTNTGITAVIDGTGAIIEEIPPGERAILRTIIPIVKDRPLTIYARLGNWFGLLALLTALGSWGMMWWRERRQDDPATSSAERPTH